MTRGIEASEGAVRAGVSREVFVRLIQNGDVKGWRRGRFYEVDAADLERFLRDRRREQHASETRSSRVGAA
jgi:excisionase family DNA binding protein